MAVSVTNTTANLSGKTIVLAERDVTITGLLTFNRGAGVAPFAITASVSKVTNFDADLLDGQDGTYYQSFANATSIEDSSVQLSIQVFQ